MTPFQKNMASQKLKYVFYFSRDLKWPRERKGTHGSKCNFAASYVCATILSSLVATGLLEM